MLLSRKIKEFVSRPLFDEDIILKKNFSYPKISIITPSYNQGEFLERTILSVLNQNYPNLEYIIIDGGSNDESQEIIKKYQKYISYWVSESDNGQSHAINKGMMLATGDIYAYLNSDDIYFPRTFDFIDKFYKKQSEEWDILYGHCYIINACDKMKKISIAFQFDLKEYGYGINFIPQPSSFWKKDLFKTIKFNENSKVCMDAEFFVNAYINGFKFKKVNRILSCFRIHDKSIGGGGRLLKESIEESIKLHRNIVRISPNSTWYRLNNAILRLKYILFKILFIINPIIAIKICSQIIKG